MPVSERSSQSEVYRAAAALQIAHTNLQWMRTSVFTVLNTASAAFVINQSTFLNAASHIKISFIFIVLLFNILLLIATVKSNRYKKYCFETLRSIEKSWIEHKQISTALYMSNGHKLIENNRLSSFTIYLAIEIIALFLWSVVMLDAMGVLKTPNVIIQ